MMVDEQLTTRLDPFHKLAEIGSRRVLTVMTQIGSVTVAVLD
jgi:hypothetical protein